MNQLSAKWEDRYDTIQRQINKVRIDMKMKQTRQKEQLAEKHQRQHEADERKIEEGEKVNMQRTIFSRLARHCHDSHSSDNSTGNSGYFKSNRMNCSRRP